MMQVEVDHTVAGLLGKDEEDIRRYSSIDAKLLWELAEVSPDILESFVRARKVDPDLQWGLGEIEERKTIPEVDLSPEALLHLLVYLQGLYEGPYSSERKRCPWLDGKDVAKDELVPPSGMKFKFVGE